MKLEVGPQDLVMQLESSTAGPPDKPLTDVVTASRQVSRTHRAKTQTMMR